MQSRVAFARAIVNHPDLLLLDEPFSDIDEATTEDMMIDVARLIAELGVTAVMVTHSLRQAAFFADQVVVLSARPGSISAHHTFPRERPRTRAFLDEPAFESAVQQLRTSLRESLHASAV
jgi:NitT/TauT family transport system ATP-binding protein